MFNLESPSASKASERALALIDDEGTRGRMKSLPPSTILQDKKREGVGEGNDNVPDADCFYRTKKWQGRTKGVLVIERTKTNDERVVMLD